MESGLKGPKSAPATTDLQVTDWCSQQFDGDAASLRLPKDPEGYAVYGRILGKPGADGGPTFDFVSRNLMLVHDEFADWTTGMVPKVTGRRAAPGAPE